MLPPPAVESAVICRPLFVAITLMFATGCIIPDAMLQAYVDRDGDGEWAEAAGGTDCRDDDARVGFTAPERCDNGIDDDCNGMIDEGGIGARIFFYDGDEDGFGDAAQQVSACVLGAKMAENPGDCDDEASERNPNVPEVCGNGIDDDCDGAIDEADGQTIWFPDFDNDGYGADGSDGVASCFAPPGYAPRSGDCDDTRADTHPNATEVPYDGVDNACDGGDDFDLDGDTFRVHPDHADPPVTDPTYAPNPALGLDCDDRDATVNPPAIDTPYDGVDSNCDGADDFDADGDGHRRIPEGEDCDDNDHGVHPGRQEIYYNAVDEDCDPSNDHDQDGDGVDHPLAGGTDCDDDDPYVWASCPTCADLDGDGAFAGCDAYGPLRPLDCHDSATDEDAARMWTTCATCADADGDGAWHGCDAYPDVPEDCDDTHPAVWQSCDACTDEDGDLHFVGCDNPIHPTYPSDCDDVVVNSWDTCGTCIDADGDGYGTGACDGPVDCNDDDPDVWVSCATCTDMDEDIGRTGCDAYTTFPFDCDDADPNVGGHILEVVDDGIDQDCDGEDLLPIDAHGRFVAEHGVDSDTCGSQADPCRTIQFGAFRAEDQGKVVFVATGDYEGFITNASVYGGYDPGSWTPAVTGETFVDVSEDSIHLRGAAIALFGVHVGSLQMATNRDGALVSAGAAACLISEVNLDFQSTGVSFLVGIGADCRRTRIRSVSITLFGDQAILRGIRLGEQRIMHASISDSSVSLSATNGAAAIGVIAHAGAIDISRTALDVLSEEDSTGLLALGGATNLNSCSIESTSSPSIDGSSIGVHVIGDATVSSVASSVRAEADLEAFGFVVEQANESRTVEDPNVDIVHTVASSHSNGTVTTLLSRTNSAQTVMSVRDSTILASASSTTTDTIAIEGASNSFFRLDDSVIVGSVGARVDGIIEGRRTLFDTDCVVADEFTASQGCVSGIPNSLPSCPDGSCVTFIDCQLAPAQFADPANLDFRPLPTSPAVGLADNPHPPGETVTDALGVPRPLSPPWTAGAFEPVP